MTQVRKAGVWRRLKAIMLKHTHGMITCIEFEAFVLDYMDGELSRRQRSTFERHLRLCRECRDYLAAYKRTLELSVTAFSAFPNDSVPKEVPKDLIKAILDARSK
jgi:anti-sigma factor RsiW